MHSLELDSKFYEKECPAPVTLVTRSTKDIILDKLLRYVL